MPYDDELYEPDQKPHSLEQNARYLATALTIILAFWLFAIIGFCHVVSNLYYAVRNYFA